MHELALADSIVRAVAERVGAARVVRVRLAIGRLTAVAPEAMRFCFEVCAQGTRLEGAALEIREVAARGRCRSCGADEELPDAIPLCRCGGADLELRNGLELNIDEVEVT
jgi:hydrogenase nickel incorporation protein HypA/HybF